MVGGKTLKGIGMLFHWCDIRGTKQKLLSPGCNIGLCWDESTVQLVFPQSWQSWLVKGCKWPPWVSSCLHCDVCSSSYLRYDEFLLTAFAAALFFVTVSIGVIWYCFLFCFVLFCFVLFCFVYSNTVACNKSSRSTFNRANLIIIQQNYPICKWLSLVSNHQNDMMSFSSHWISSVSHLSHFTLQFWQACGLDYYTLVYAWINIIVLIDIRAEFKPILGRLQLDTIMAEAVISDLLILKQDKTFR
jgi:hypothetical protein